MNADLRAAVIRRHPPSGAAAPAAASTPDFRSLRAATLQLVQAMAGQRWTDYNLHDPGVTLLEALCYALTGLAYRADFDVADHLCADDGRIDFERHALFAPDQALPPRPTSVDDLRRALLERLPELADARLTALGLPGARDGTPAALLSLRIEPDPAAAAATPAIGSRSLELLRRWRGLGEDLDDAVTVVTHQRMHLVGHLEIGGARDPAALLAEVYSRCAARVALRSGGEDAADDARQGAELADEVSRIDGVARVKELTLVADDPGASAPPDPRGRAPAATAPVVATPGGGADLRAVRLTRRGTEVLPDAAAVAAAFDDLCAARGGPRARTAAAKPAPMPEGRPIGEAPYVPVQTHLPPAYGLDLQPSAAPDQPARARPGVQQLRAYLAVFDQVMANAQAQLDHLRELFAIDGDTRRSQWWLPLGETQIPGLGALSELDPATLQAAAFAPFDGAADRRHRVLDLLLALHGQSCPQKTMRQFLWHLEPDELEQRLLDNKIAMLQRVVEVNRDRAAAFDYARPSWNRPDNTCGLVRNLSLLAGLRHCVSRSLVAPIDALAAEFTAPAVRPGDMASLDRAERALLQPLPPAATAGTASAIDCALGVGFVDPLWLRAGQQRQRYRWLPPAAAGGKGQLLLEAEAPLRWWRLGRFEHRDAAAQAADALRRRLLEHDDACEGLHVVEHVLLRPRAARAHRGVGPDFHALRLTVVMPDWTQRGAQDAYRDFVTETVQLACPAHLLAECLWIGPQAMREFESVLTRWLARLAAHAAAAPPTDDDRVALDAAAAPLVALLLRHGATPG